MRALLAIALFAVAVTAAAAQVWIMGPSPGGPTTTGAGSFSHAAPLCTADGKTDWSNPCDIPLGVALGVL